MLSYLLFSAIDRAEIVFHHLYFLSMYVQYHRQFFSTPT